MKPTNPIRQPWDGQLIQPHELRPEVKRARQVLYDDLVARWKTNLPESLWRFYLTATQLDPSQKKLRFQGLTSLDRHEAYEWFVSEYESLWNKTSAAAPRPERRDKDATAARAPGAGATFVDFMASLSHLHEAGQANGKEETPQAVAKSEIEKYMEMPEVPVGADILKWWVAHEADLPQLSFMMARQYLGCPATSASAERLFSIAGRVYDDLRQNMDEPMLEAVMWARVNKEKRSACVLSA